MEWNKINKYAGIVLFGLVILWMLSSLINQIRLSNDYRITVGTTLRSQRTGKGPVCYYRITVNGKAFDSSAPVGIPIDYE